MTERRMAAWIFVLFAAIYGMTARGYLSSYDYHDRLLLTRAMVEGGTLEIEGGVRSYAGSNGASYSIYDPGESVLLIPFYVAGRTVAEFAQLGPTELVEQAACSLLFPLATALSVALLFLVFRESTGAGRRRSFFLSCVYGLCTIAWPYSKWHAVQSIETVFLLAALLCLVLRAGPRPFRAGCFVAAGVLCRSSLLVAVPALVWLAWSRGGWKRALQFVGPLVPAALGLLAYNHLRFGHPMALGYGSWIAQFSTPWLVGISGLLLSPGRGFLFFVPTVWLLPWAWKRFRSEHSSLAIVVVGISLGYLLFYGRFEAWYGTESWGPRYLVPLLPITLLPLAALSTVARRWLVAVAFVGVVFQVPPLVASPSLYFRSLDRLAAAGEVVDPIYDIRQSPLVLHWREALDLLTDSPGQGGPAFGDVAGEIEAGHHQLVRALPNFWFFYAKALGVNVGWVTGLMLLVAAVGSGAFWMIERSFRLDQDGDHVP